jgi:subtilisin family serine protease
VVAPGINVRSSYVKNVYKLLSGTSMAAPHVAGLAALLISAEPELAGDVNRLEQAIAFSALPKTTLQKCGSYPGDQVPNAVFGRGRVDAVNAWLLITGSRYYLPLVFVQSDSPSSLLREVR